MHRAAILACTGLLGLSACHKQPTVKLTNASVDQVMNQPGATVKLKPGLWEVSVAMLDHKITGAPAGMPAMAGMPQQAEVKTKTCLTQAQVDKPTAMFGGGMDQIKNGCTFDTFEMSGGKVNTVMHCKMPGGQMVAASTHGTFSATDMSADSESKVAGMPGGMGMTSHTKMTAKRVGDCPDAASAAG